MLISILSWIRTLIPIALLGLGFVEPGDARDLGERPPGRCAESSNPAGTAASGCGAVHSVD